MTIYGMRNYVDYTSITSYRKCLMKRYDAYLCMPPKDTVVIDKIKYPDVVSKLGKDYFTVDELKNTNEPKLNLIKQAVQMGYARVVTNEKPFIIAGVRGELTVANIDEVLSRFEFDISLAALRRRVDNGSFDWLSMHSIPNKYIYWACFIPKAQSFTLNGVTVNGIGDHGKGDFIVANDVYGQPDLNNISIVNGSLFSLMFNNKGWKDCIVEYNSNICIANLPVFVKEDRGVNTDVGSLYMDFISGGFSDSSYEDFEKMTGTVPNYDLERFCKFILLKTTKVLFDCDDSEIAGVNSCDNPDTIVASCRIPSKFKNADIFCEICVRKNDRHVCYYRVEDIDPKGINNHKWAVCGINNGYDISSIVIDRDKEEYFSTISSIKSKEKKNIRKICEQTGLLSKAGGLLSRV